MSEQQSLLWLFVRVSLYQCTIVHTPAIQGVAYRKLAHQTQI